MGFAIRVVMMDAEPLPPRRGRRALIALLTLLLILLPLYLWPLRGGLGGLPGASSLRGWPRDPRSAVAVAQIPANVWDALMGRADTLPPSPPAVAPRNLTMISDLEGLTDSGLDLVDDGSALADPSSVARGLVAQLGGPAGSSYGGLGGDDSAPSLPQFFSSSSGDGSGSGFSPSVFPFGNGYPGFGDLGPSSGGGPGGSGPPLSSLSPTFELGPGAPAPTPEPATLVLIGSNLALLGGAAWKRHRRRRETLSME